MAPFRLIFASAPYAEHFVVPDGVRVMSAAAFAKGCPPPRVIDVPDSLERVDGSMNPETLWRASDPAALARIVARAEVVSLIFRPWKKPVLVRVCRRK